MPAVSRNTPLLAQRARVGPDISRLGQYPNTMTPASLTAEIIRRVRGEMPVEDATIQVLTGLARWAERE
jgi:hypothetical protein